MENVTEGIGEQGKERREGNEEVWELSDGPVSERADIPVDRLDVVVDEGDGI